MLLTPRGQVSASPKTLSLETIQPSRILPRCSRVAAHENSKRVLLRQYRFQSLCISLLRSCLPRFVDPAAPPEPTLPRNYSALKRAHKQRSVPELREEDIDESFVRGRGDIRMTKVLSLISLREWARWTVDKQDQE